MAGMLTAAVSAAGMTLVVVRMVTAFCIRIKRELPFGKLRCRLIRTALHPAEHLNASRCQRGAGACANAAADQRFDAKRSKEICQCAVAGAVGGNNAGRKHLAVLYLIHFKRFGMTEVLKDHSVVIGYCYFHF